MAATAGLWCSKYVYFQMVFVCCVFHLAFGGQLRELTVGELQNLGHSTKMDFIAVFFDRPGKADTKYLREFEKASKTLQAYRIELATVNCEGKSISPCTSVVQKTYICRNGESNFQEFPISHMFNEDAVVANVLHATLFDEYLYIGDEQSLSELLSMEIGKKDVLFSYIKALGTAAHRHFLELVSRSKQQTLFALTTDANVAKKFGISTQGDAAVVLFHCKEQMIAARGCRTTQYQGKINKVHLAQFVQAQRIPKYVILPSSKTTVYDSLPVRVNKVFVFTDRISDLPHDQLEEMAVEFQGSLGIIVVDVNEHKDMLQSFGLSENSSLPTAALVPIVDKKKNVTYVELYPETVALFSISYFKKFIKPMIEHPSEEYMRIAETSSLLQVSYVVYADAMKDTDTNYFLANNFLFVVFCNEDHEPCKKFFPTYRRIVRTFDRAGEQRITLAYVKTALHNRKFEEETFPVVRLHLTKSSSEYIQYADKLEYDDLLDFIADHTGVPRPLSLPLSLSDLPPITMRAVDEDADFPVEEELTDEETGTENTDDSSPLPAEETEDDEVAAAVLQAPPTVVPEDLVPTLTDKTFDITKETHDLLVVDFYQPWDPRSRAFLQPYVDAATSLGGLDVGEFSIKLARVNCFDWNDVCEKNNVTRYPTVKMFRKGSNELIYKGPLDSDHVTKAALLLQPSVPFSLVSKEEASMFLQGKLPKLAEKATNTAVLGMFPDGNDKAFKAFESSAVTLRSNYLLGYITGETAQTLSAEYGLSIPSIILFKRNDPYQPTSVFTDRFTPESITDFTRFSSIPSFDELTPLNLPTYLAHQRPLLIVFRANNEEAVITPVMKKIARDRDALPSVFLCWMPVNSETDVNSEILEAYTGSKTGLPVLVLLNHDKGAVYQFKGEVTKPAVVTWVERVLSGKQQASSLLKGGEWKPLLEGYNFLRMIDEEEEAEERRRQKRRKLEATLDDEEWPESTPDTEDTDWQEKFPSHDEL